MGCLVMIGIVVILAIFSMLGVFSGAVSNLPDLSGNTQVILFAVIFVAAIVAFIFIMKKSGNAKDLPAPPKPVRTKILDSGSDGTKSGGVGRAIVGDMVSHAVGVKGPVGAIVGATTAGHKNKGFTVFRVWYDNGDVEVEKTAHTDDKYMEYLRLLDEE